MNFVAIDFETTGYECGHVNEPWQLGMAIVKNGKIVMTKEWFFKTSKSYDTPRGNSRDFPLTILEQWEEIFSFIGNTRLVAHNIACEKTILTRLAPLTKLGPWVDTLKLAKTRYPKIQSYKLGDLCEMFGCVPQLDSGTWHDGLYDAVACAELAVRLAVL